MSSQECKSVFKINHLLNLLIILSQLAIQRIVNPFTVKEKLIFILFLSMFSTEGSVVVSGVVVKGKTQDVLTFTN